MNDLRAFLKREVQANKKKTVFPRGFGILRGHESHALCSKVKVVIIGQDPYHGPNQAHGLCFSVPAGRGCSAEPSKHIQRVENRCGLSPPPKHGNLQALGRARCFAAQRDSLRSRAEKAGSHQKKGWEQFTDAVIDHLNRERSGLVFVLWGSYAQKKGEFIDRKKHLVLAGPHPSPLSAHRGFFGCRHFSKINEYLKCTGQSSD